jgi:hypothetical protein
MHRKVVNIEAVQAKKGRSEGFHPALPEKILLTKEYCCKIKPSCDSEKSSGMHHAEKVFPADELVIICRLEAKILADKERLPDING